MEVKLNGEALVSNNQGADEEMTSEGRIGMWRQRAEN